MNRRTVLASAATAVLATAGGTLSWWWSRPDAAPAQSGQPSLGTVAVVRTDLEAREQVAGTLGYAGDWRVAHPGPPGVLTFAPPPGTVVRRGQRLYEVDGRPVRLLYGQRPVWREFGPGMVAGEDVRQLERNLAALGLRPSTVDARFTTATGAAVRRLRSRLGLARTGRLPLGTFVFVPAALRVVEVLVPLGERLGGGPVLRASSTRRVVTVALPTSRQRSLSRGGAVLVTLPGGQRLPATVAEVGRVAVAPAGSGSGPSGPATISVTATLDDPAAAAGLDQAPVQVTIATTRRTGVLSVPVTALIAAPTGGYEVVAVDAGSRRPVTVRPGLFDELSGLIEVTGEGLAPGVRVEVPRR